MLSTEGSEKKRIILINKMALIINIIKALLLFSCQMSSVNTLLILTSTDLGYTKFTHAVFILNVN